MCFLYFFFSVFISNRISNYFCPLLCVWTRAVAELSAVFSSLTSVVAGPRSWPASPSRPASNWESRVGNHRLTVGCSAPGSVEQSRLASGPFGFRRGLLPLTFCCFNCFAVCHFGHVILLDLFCCCLPLVDSWLILVFCYYPPSIICFECEPLQPLLFASPYLCFKYSF